MSGPGYGASAPGDRGARFDQSGQIDILSQLMGPLSGILNALGMNPDGMALNALTGNPYAGQMGRFSGRTPRQADVMGWENQQTYFNLQNEEASKYRTRVADHWFGMQGQKNAGTRAQNAASSIYNPVGLATRLGMMAYGEKGSQRAMSQGFMAMNMYAPGPGENLGSGNYKNDQIMMSNFQEQMDADFFAPGADYGGFNLQGRSEVFQQMSQRSMVGKQDIAERSKSTSKSVQKMSQAVGAMQELFGGTIPELFDKMDAIFGGNASAMGGDQLMNRVMKMKQTSQLTGQSLGSLAQMSMMGGQYAEMAGADAGIGAMAASETALALGVNYSGGLTSTRRINQGRLRSASLRSNTSAATSRMSQYYAGAFMSFVEGQGYDYADMRKNPGNYTMSIGDLDDLFAEKAAGKTSVGELADIDGVGSVNDIRNYAMGNNSKEYRADYETATRFAIQGKLTNAQGAIGRSMQRAIKAAGNDVDMKVFMTKDGQLRATSDIKRLLKKEGVSKANLNLIDNQMEQAGGVLFGGLNGEELEAHIYQVRNAGGLRELRDSRALFDTEMGGGVGGVLGVMNFLGSDKAKTANIGQAIGAALGLLTPEDQRKKLSITERAEKGTALATKMRSAYRLAQKAGDNVKADKIATVMNQLTNSNAIAGMSSKDQTAFLANLEGGDYEAAFNQAASDKQRLADKTLTDAGLSKKYSDALHDDGDMTKANTIAKNAAVASALKGIQNEEVREKVRKAIYVDKDGKERKTGSIQEYMNRTKDVKFGSDEVEQKFKADVKAGADALKVGDPQVDMQSVLSRLADVLEKWYTDRPANNKGPE